MKNLWMNLGTLTPELKNPIDIIRTQSDYLSDGTNGLLCISDSEVRRLGPQAKMALEKQKLKAVFMYRIEIASDYLPEYSYEFMTLAYDITFYPLVVTIPKEIVNDIEREPEFDFFYESEFRKYYNVKNQDEFERILEAVFNCEKIRLIMQNMKAIIGDIELED